MNKLFDSLWNGSCAIPLENLSDVYSPPKEYDNYTKIRLRLINKDLVFLEGNRKFKLRNSNKDYFYYDTVKINFPKNNFECVNKIFLKFPNSNHYDSLYLGVSISDKNEIYWKQIFFCSVIVSELNTVSNDSELFRIDDKKLVSENLLENNEALINAAYNNFNINKDTIKLRECLCNSTIFKTFCDHISLPCRIVTLSGGNAIDAGLETTLGYPTHALCEIYSSKEKKWFVVDPSFGFTYMKDSTRLNAIEISDKVFFMTQNNIKQDSVLFTKSNSVGNDYYKYFENVYFESNYKPNFLFKKIFDHFYSRFNFYDFHYANNYLFNKNGYYYLITKSLAYFLIFLVFFNSFIVILVNRLYKSKRLVTNNLK